MGTPGEERRLFGDFLRARREEITPESIGLPRVGHPRRVKGLRREEVAQLASVSSDYYTRLEQGKLPAPSEAVFGALVRALRLDADEERYLRIIADRSRRPGEPEPASQEVSPEFLVLLENLSDLPALVLGRHLDVLAWNSLAVALFTDFSALPERERNIIRLVYLNEEMRSRFKDWPSAAQTGASLLRMDAARFPDDPGLSKIVSELAARDRNFATWWASQRVVSSAHGMRTYVHPLAGEFELEWHMLNSSASPDQGLVVMTPPPDSSGHEALRRLARSTGAAERVNASR